MTGSGLVNQQVWLGFCDVEHLKIRVRPLIHLAVETIPNVRRPSQSDLVIQLIAVDALSIYGSGPMNR
jgi:hypothetical protein